MRQARSNFDRKRRSEPSSSFIIISATLSFFTPPLLPYFVLQNYPARVAFAHTNHSNDPLVA